LQVLPQNFENPTSMGKLLITLALMIVGGIILGLVVYRYFIQPLSGTSRISIVLMTLAALFLLEAVVDLIWPGDSGFMALPGITIGFQINETTYIRLFDLLPPVVGLVVWLALVLFYRDRASACKRLPRTLLSRRVVGSTSITLVRFHGRLQL
jgi:branched-subunit amino acid ABC-type transport system permease component